MKKAFVVGYPVHHSRSPLIHTYWINRYGLKGSYEKQDVSPNKFELFLKDLNRAGFLGGNVTIPHKEKAFLHVKKTTQIARKLKAVNTLWFESGILWGDNTDMMGFTAHLDESFGFHWEKSVSQALVLGAGGAARAIVAGLIEKNISRILVANRTLERAQELSHFDTDKIIPVPWEQVRHYLAETHLLVNTTSLGMKNQPALDLDITPLPKNACVADIVYVPLETPLLAQARHLQLKSADGLGMLLHQAVPGFEKWFSIRPQVTLELRHLIEADIEKTS
jgi:shikimate dehydrogenase